jgi:hypothetical protein
VDAADRFWVIRLLRSRLVALLLLAAFYFHPQLGTALIMEVAHQQAQRITTPLKEALAESAFTDSQQHRPQRTH